MKLSQLVYVAFNNSVNYKITCNQVNRTRFTELTAPIRDIVSEFLHDSNGACYEWFDGHRLKIATWPQYARVEENGTVNSRISGYVHGIPECVARPEHRSLVLGKLLEPFGENIRHYPRAMMPTDYASFSVVGANVDLFNEYVAKTGLFGHFESFAEVPRNTTRASLSLSGCDLALPFYKPVSPAEQIFDFIPISQKGLTIVADIDDVLRVTEIWNWKRTLLSAFVRDFIPWSTMPDIFAVWGKAVSDIHFHYATDTPEMSHQFLVDGVGKHYPMGSFDFRPMGFDSWQETINPRYINLKRLISTFKDRKFVLLGDDSTGSVLSTYSRLGHEFPRQVRCIMIREVSATEPANWIIGNLASLKGLPHILFQRPEDLLASTSFLERLAEGHEDDCRSLGRHEKKMHGFLMSWILTVHKGMSALLRCALVWNVRPNGGLCPFDRSDFVKN